MIPTGPLRSTKRRPPEPRCWYCCHISGNDPTNIETNGLDARPFYCRDCGNEDIILTHFGSPFKPWYRRRWVLILLLVFCYGVGILSYIAAAITYLMLQFAQENIEAMEYSNSLPL